MSATVRVEDLLELDSLLSLEDIELRQTVHRFEPRCGRTLAKAQLLALHLGRLKDDGRIRPEQVSVGKLNNVREAIKIARECRTLLGANGITLEYPVIRHANNLESVLTYEGTSEVHQLVIGEALTGVSAFR
jgi:glutaryl-CoA dehydrogenase